ncbi:uncharacterized protein BX664DRAFT_389125 [Halteromyces radiatus]|uniref:uncharacterized protein n=1 Tax=Halteromyces radiatus TaxID=101107 RepID=UPI00222110DD|nr:uncharacterized protein BX664DRAFT_389125 [Halteromyces radiatus]KAI8078734.1 hypothetical protein BX664DRAFT_389125 [Halteromyces radiatus]
MLKTAGMQYKLNKRNNTERRVRSLSWKWDIQLNHFLFTNNNNCSGVPGSFMLQIFFLLSRLISPGSVSNKQLMLCLSESQRKLLDGIGFSGKGKIERVMMECSGEQDGNHTEEDTLKLMEYTSNCLKNEMNQYQYASWTTFGRRRIFACAIRMGIGKWCFVEILSAIVPRDWEDRYYLNRLMELLMKLKPKTWSSNTAEST